MKKFGFSFGAAFLLSGYLNAAPPTAEEIIRKADEIRNPSESYQMGVDITSSEKSGEVSSFEVFLKGNEKTLIKTLAPARDRGRNLLMLNEDMWAYVPNLKRSVRVSLNQKLMGDAANGDISRMRWAGDYDGKIENESKEEWQLFLTAKKKGLTYEKLRIWISKKDFAPLRAEYLTPQGKVLKKAAYKGYKTLAGRFRPSEILIEDAVRTSSKSTIKIISMEVKNFADSLFNQNNLGK